MAIKSNSTILMASYRHVRNRVNNLNENLKREYFSNEIALETGNLKETWKTLNLLLHKRSKTTNVESLNVHGEVITENSNIARSMNEFFCIVGRNLSVKIPQQLNPLLSGDYKINESAEQPTGFKFHPVDVTTINLIAFCIHQISGLDLIALRVTSRGEWPSGLNSLRQVTEVKLGRVRSDFGWVTTEA